MKKMALPLVIGSMALILGGCSPIPVATNFQATTQYKVQAAQHWQVIAKHLSAKVKETGYLTGSKLYIDSPDVSGVFGQVFPDMLTSELVSSGVHVTENPDHALTLTSEVVTVRHPHDRDGLHPFLGTAAVATYYLFKELKDSVVAPVLIIASDVARLQPSETATEITVTTKLKDGDRILFSETGVYYIPDKAAFHYSGKTIQLTTEK